MNKKKPIPTYALGEYLSMEEIAQLIDLAREKNLTSFRYHNLSIDLGPVPVDIPEVKFEQKPVVNDWERLSKLPPESQDEFLRIGRRS